LLRYLLNNYSSQRRALINKKNCWVVKIGSALLTADGEGLALDSIQHWVQQMADLHQQGIQLVLVSSGAVAEGMCRLGWQQRPHTLHQLQAAAAVGQMGLIQAYESAFQQYGLHTAQILLTHEDLSDRGRYLNARSTLRTLLEMNVIPVVNENDTVATDEICFGDNDSLAALVANLVEADQLVILTDQEGLFDKNPSEHADACLIHEASAEDASLQQMAGGSGALGRGGMLTKVQAAARAARSGTSTVIASGRTNNVLALIAQGKNPGTLLRPSSEPVAAHKQWLAAQLQVRGKLFLDAGAVKVLQAAGKSLLPIGVSHIEGEFLRGELVACVAPDGGEIARGLVNYDTSQTQQIIGHASSEIEDLLGFVDEAELIHRDNLVLLHIS